MTNIWCTTDTHFLHDKLCLKEYCNRPIDHSYKIFKGLERIPENDILIHLGDISIGNEIEVHERFIKPLSCRAILVKGNHDRKTNAFYTRMGWDFVCYAFQDTYFKKKILFSHFPKPADDYDFNLFGHFHNNVKSWNDVSPKYRKFINEKHLLLALEHTHYQPMKLNYIISKPDKFRLVNMLK